MADTMSPRVRKLALTAHIAVSVGWLGAVAAYFALDVTVTTSQDAQLVAAAWIGTGLIGWYVIVPLAVASLLTGLVMGLGTRWGLFRHYWVLISFLLTLVSFAVLLTQVEHFSAAASTDVQPTPASVDRRVRGSTLLHSGGGLLVLLVITTLNVYKPRGLTPYGWRKLQEERSDPE